MNVFSWIQLSLEKALLAYLSQEAQEQRMALRLEDVFKYYTQIEPATRTMFDKQIQPILEKHSAELLVAWPKIPVEWQQIIRPLMSSALSLPEGGGT